MKLSWIEKKCLDIERRSNFPYTCASGISVSGVLHPGKLRDIFIANQIYEELKKRGKEVRLIYFIDDFDRFKKAPKGLNEYEKFIGLPYSKIPSPSEESNSFVNYFFNEFNECLNILNIKPELIFESQRYAHGEYTSEIETVYKNINKIQEIFKEVRNKKIEPSDLFHIYCEDCNKDNPISKKLNDNHTLDYLCSCGYKGNISIFEPDRIKLSWVANWPSRWNKEGTSFEPIGPDHAAPQGCFEISREIYKRVFNKTPPIVQTYGFINLKGGRKLSSSETKISLKDMINIYDPHVIRWIFSSKKPETFFEINLEEPFDNYDKADREFMISIPKFREIVSSLNANLGEYSDLERDSPFQIGDRIKRAKNWNDNYASNNFKWDLLKEPNKRNLLSSERKFREALVNLSKESYNEKNLENKIYDLMKEQNLDRKEQFSKIYEDLFGKPFGPKLAKIILKLNYEQIKKLLLYQNE